MLMNYTKACNPYSKFSAPVNGTSAIGCAEKAIFSGISRHVSHYRLCIKDGRKIDFACGTGGFLTSWLKELEKEVKTTEDRAAFGQSIYGIEKKQFPYMLCITNMLQHDLDVPQVFHDNSLLRDVLDYTVNDQFDVILMNPPYGGSEKAEVKNHFPADLASSETAAPLPGIISLQHTGDLPSGILMKRCTIRTLFIELGFMAMFFHSISKWSLNAIRASE